MASETAIALPSCVTDAEPLPETVTAAAAARLRTIAALDERVAAHTALCLKLCVTGYGGGVEYDRYVKACEAFANTERSWVVAEFAIARDAAQLPTDGGDHAE